MQIVIITLVSFLLGDDYGGDVTYCIHCRYSDVGCNSNISVVIVVIML